MKALVTTASAIVALLLATGSASYGQQPQNGTAGAAATCTGQILPNSSFERGTTGWTAGPRIVVLGSQDKPAHTGRAYASLAGLDVTHTDLLRTSVTVPAGCTLTVRFWVRTTTTETTRGDSMNVGLYVDGTPPKTIYALAYSGPSEWWQYSSAAGTSTVERNAMITFSATETTGNGVTTFDVDDVTFNLS